MAFRYGMKVPISSILFHGSFDKYLEAKGIEGIQNAPRNCLVETIMHGQVSSASKWLSKITCNKKTTIAFFGHGPPYSLHKSVYHMIRVNPV